MTTLDEKHRRAAEASPEERDQLARTQAAEIRAKNTVSLPDDWQPISMAEAMQNRPPIKYAVSGLFELPSLNIVYGAPGCLKSFLMADMAACVANGTPWLEPLPGGKLQAKPTDQGAVIWLDLDNGKRRTQDRFKWLLTAHKFTDQTPINVFCHPSPPFRADNESDIKLLCARVEKYGARVLVIDNLGTVTGDAEENGADMARVMANFRYMAEYTGAAIILIHHQRKGGANGGRAGDALRGHSSIEASLDLALWVEREPGSDTITITPTKTRGADVDPFAAYFAYEGSGGDLETARFFGYPCEVETERGLTDWALETLKAALKTETEINQTRFRELLQEGYEGPHTMSDKKARRLIAALENTGKVKTAKGERGAKNYTAY